MNDTDSYNPPLASFCWSLSYQHYMCHILKLSSYARPVVPVGHLLYIYLLVTYSRVEFDNIDCGSLIGI